MIQYNYASLEKSFLQSIKIERSLPPCKKERKGEVTRWDSFLVLDLGLDVLNGVIRLNVQGNRLSGEGLDEDLHGTTSKTKDKMKGRFLLNVIIR